jgi:hypothetical protein
MMPKRPPTIEEIAAAQERIASKRKRRESTVRARDRLSSLLHDRLRAEVRAMRRRAK